VRSLLRYTLGLCVLLAVATSGAAAAPPGPVSEGATASAAYDTYIACGRERSDPPASQCDVGDPVGAFFRSNGADATYSVCVTFPTGKQLCAEEQLASQGALYVNAVTTSIPGRHTVTWSVNGVVLSESFTLVRAAPPADPTLVCGLLPGEGAYSYIETKGIGCGAGKRVAQRAHKKFCAPRDGCLIQPPTPIAKVYRGQVRYRGWSCRIKDGWELLSVRCQKGEMWLVQKSGA